ncbi:MAG TPA: CarD family transcriptional regulator, partial [Actinomycetota bacterium]|nr:CarD family transcriptional regulator [Actinomycetota bacterium]
MEKLLEPLIESEAFQGLLARSGARVGRADPAGHAYVAAGIAAATESPALLLAPGPKEAERLAGGAAAFVGADRVALFPAWEALPVEGISPAPEIAARRAAAAHRARATSGAFVLVAPIVAALQRLVPTLGAQPPLAVEPGTELPPDRLADALVERGYVRADLVTHRGEFAVRGGIVDVFPGTASRPVRLDFFGDDVERIREFSAASQTSTRTVERAEIHPVRELLPSHDVRELAGAAIARHKGTLRDALERLSEGLVFEGMERIAPLVFEEMPVLADLLPSDAWVTISSVRRTLDRAAAAVVEADALAGETELRGAMRDPDAALGGRPRLDLTEFAEGADLGIRAWTHVAGRGEETAAAAASLASRGFRVGVTAAARGSLERSLEVLGRAGLAAPDVAAEAELFEGFVFEPGRVAVVGEDDLFGRRRVTHDAPRVTGRTAAAFAQELAPGDFAVHRVHGVGRYLGMVHRAVAGSERDYLLLEYAAGDRLYVPADQVDVVAKYIGGQEPRLHRLGSADWPRATARVRRAVRDMAGELVRLYTARMAVPGHAFGPDTPWQRELEDAFPHQETRDQLVVAQEVKRDMELPKAMDRLICGDVGYGKTEIAVRAAFKAVADGKQVAVLVPTTLLAEQHHVTFSE